MRLPRAPDRLPDEFAAAIGHAVSGFGFLEEALKRAIFALTRERLGETPDEASLAAWLVRMHDVADDSLGTLIDQFVAQMQRSQIKGADSLAHDLRRIKRSRNLLCHASWKRVDGSERWHPAFLNTKGEPFPEAMSAAEITEIHAETLEIAARIVSIMRATGIRGGWIGQDDPDPAG